MGERENENSYQYRMRKQREMMDDLQKQIKEKFEIHKQLDKLSKNQMVRYLPANSSPRTTSCSTSHGSTK